MGLVYKIYWLVIKYIPYLKVMYYTKQTQNPVTWKFIIWQKIIGLNRKAYWPMHFTSIVGDVKNIYAGIDVCPGYSPGCYIQTMGKVYIGDYTQIAPNVGIISANHELEDSREHRLSHVTIGKYCWIGMNAVILPSVELGDFTIVAAGSVVTKSFEDGFCVIGGNPARLIKKLDSKKCIPFKNQYEYHGYISASDFSEYRKKKLKI